MRLTAAILALLIALLSCLPCADLHAAPKRTSVEALTVLGSEAAHGHHDGPDLCSPFCQCACCSVASALMPSGTWHQFRKTQYGPLQYHEFQPAGPVRISMPVWEPPR